MHLSRSLPRGLNLWPKINFSRNGLQNIQIPVIGDTLIFEEM